MKIYKKINEYLLDINRLNKFYRKYFFQECYEEAYNTEKQVDLNDLSIIKNLIQKEDIWFLKLPKNIDTMENIFEGTGYQFAFILKKIKLDTKDSSKESFKVFLVDNQGFNYCRYIALCDDKLASYLLKNFKFEELKEYNKDPYSVEFNNFFKKEILNKDIDLVWKKLLPYNLSENGIDVVTFSSGIIDGLFYYNDNDDYYKGDIVEDMGLYDYPNANFSVLEM
jgi:hypothetical protein